MNFSGVEICDMMKVKGHQTMKSFVVCLSHVRRSMIPGWGFGDNHNHYLKTLGDVV